MANDDTDRRTAALLRSEARALERLAMLRGDLIGVLTLLDRVVPRTAAPRLDAGNLIPLARRERHRKDLQK